MPRDARRQAPARMLSSKAMGRPRRILPLLIAVMLGVQTAQAFAADARRGKRAAKTAAVATAAGGAAAVAAARPAAGAPREGTPASPADEAFLAARQAALQGSIERFEAAAPRVDAAMRSYVDYWRLRFRLTARGGPAGSEAATDAEAAAFIARTDNPLLADLARRDWLQHLARRGDWSTFDAQYRQWVLRDESPLHCHAGVGSLALGGPVGDEARNALFQPRELSEACGMLLERLAVSPERAAGAMGAGRAAEARETARADPSGREAAWWR